MDKRLITSLSLSVCVVAYSVTTINKSNHTDVANLNVKPAQYQSAIESTANQYLKLAQTKVDQPTSNCYQLPVSECLYLLTPTEPRLVNVKQPENAIALQAKLVNYQVSLDAIALAKVKSTQIKLPGLAI